jgi:hypothetical protein
MISLSSSSSCLDESRNFYVKSSSDGQILSLTRQEAQQCDFFNTIMTTCRENQVTIPYPSHLIVIVQRYCVQETSQEQTTCDITMMMTKRKQYQTIIPRILPLWYQDITREINTHDLYLFANLVNYLGISRLLCCIVRHIIQHEQSILLTNHTQLSRFEDEFIERHID